MNFRFIFLVGIGISVAQVALAGYGTNSFFVTLNEWQGGHPNPEEIELAKTNIECQPAENDSAGHWGEKIIGEQLSIRFAKDVFQTNESVIAVIIYRHAGTNDNLNCSWMFGGDLDFQFVVKNEDGNSLPDSFAPLMSSLPTTRKWLPGTQYKYQSNLTKRYGLSKPGTYSVSVRRKAFKDTNGWVYVSSGAATIKMVTATNAPSVGAN
jgi:hypothetical protein